MRLSIKLAIIGLIITAISGIIVPIIIKMIDKKDPGINIMQKAIIPDGNTNDIIINKTIVIPREAK